METEGREAAPDGVGASPLMGRVGIVVGGKTVAVLAVEDGRAGLTEGDGADVSATILCPSLEEFRKLASGQLNMVVVSLKGDFGVRGDLAFGIKVIRALQAGMPLDGPNPKGG